MAKNSKTEQMDWTDLTTAEIHAISIINRNAIDGTVEPAFPFLDAVFDELANELKGIIATREQSAVAVAGEINAIVKVLIDVIPTATNDELQALSDTEIKRYLLKSISLRFLISVLNRLSDSITTVNAEMLN